VNQADANSILLGRARHAVETDRMLGIDQVLLDTPQVELPTETDAPVPPVAVVPERMTIDTDDGSGEEGAQPASTRVTISDIPGDSASERLEALRAMHDADCPHCTKATGHERTVFGEGSATADLMFVGEAPGAEEDRTGRPFVGPSGKKLDEMIKALGHAREDVYIANVLKSRPPNNRTPLEHEVTGCSPYLAAQVDIIKPRVIVTLGGPAAQFILSTRQGITRLRGNWGLFRTGQLEVPVMPTFHPAYLLRNYTHEVRSQVWHDLQAAQSKLTAP
jgi:DNA polymerase